MVDAHTLAEARSLAFHAHVAARIGSDPTIVLAARERVRAWLAERPERAYAQAWADILDRSNEELIALLIDERESATAMRQSTPFAGALDPRTRWRIHAEVRARLEGRG